MFTIFLAIEKTFPEAKLMFCILHLKQNLELFLGRKMQMNKDERTQIIREIFGSRESKEGLIWAQNENSFDLRLGAICRNHEFMTTERYMVEFVDRLRRNVCNQSWVSHGMLKGVACI